MAVRNALSRCDKRCTDHHSYWNRTITSATIVSRNPMEILLSVTLFTAVGAAFVLVNLAMGALGRHDQPQSGTHARDRLAARSADGSGVVSRSTRRCRGSCYKPERVMENVVLSSLGRSLSIAHVQGGRPSEKPLGKMKSIRR